jgi:hypothetical protein
VLKRIRTWQIKAKPRQRLLAIPTEKVQTLKGWDEYVDKASKLSILRTETQKAKNSVRDALKQRRNENGDIDFGDGDRIRVFRIFRKQQQGRRTRSLDLSASFVEQRLEGPSETKGISDETEESITDLDPVTERLMDIMRKKAER